MEPRCCIHRLILWREREMYHNIVRRKHFVNTCYANTFWSACCSRCIKSCRFIIYRKIPIQIRIFCRCILHKIRIFYRTRYRSHSFFVHHNYHFRCEFWKFQCLFNSVFVDWFIYKYCRSAVLNSYCNFTGWQSEIYRTTYCTCFMTSDICKRKFRAIQKLEHHYSAFYYSGVQNRIWKTVCFWIKFRICPSSLCFGRNHSLFICKSVNISHKSVKPRIFSFKLRFKHIYTLLLCICRKFCFCRM